MSSLEKPTDDFRTCVKCGRRISKHDAVCRITPGTWDASGPYCVPCIDEEQAEYENERQLVNTFGDGDAG